MWQQKEQLAIHVCSISNVLKVKLYIASKVPKINVCSSNLKRDAWINWNRTKKKCKNEWWKIKRDIENGEIYFKFDVSEKKLSNLLFDIHYLAIFGGWMKEEQKRLNILSWESNMKSCSVKAKGFRFKIAQFHEDSFRRLLCIYRTFQFKFFQQQMPTPMCVLMSPSKKWNKFLKLLIQEIKFIYSYCVELAHTQTCRL